MSNPIATLVFEIKTVGSVGHVCSDYPDYRAIALPGLYGWMPPQLEIACPPTVDQESHSVVLKLILVAVTFGGCLYMGKKGAGEGWLSWSNPYTSFSSPGTASGRSIGRVAVPTELPEVAVPRYQAPSLVQF